MISALEDAVRGYWPYKISTVLVLLILFFGSVMVMDQRIDANSDAAIANVEVTANLSAVYAFQHYYNSTNQSQNVQKMQGLREDTLDSSQTVKRGKVYQAALFTGFAIKQIDPFYRVPCLETSDGCIFYLDKSVRQEISSILDKSGSEQFLRDFADNYNLTVEERFYNKYSRNNTGTPGSFGASLLEKGSGKELDATTFTVNALYLAILGLIISTFAAFLREMIKGDRS
ncbi:hypothetical protein GKQ38_01145 [Candidatus Nanohaloarchaea archaeon]|nr:hypothetical protein GKQ38_01145 [Candidatus Nanohaloarchaea archaeon]